jgi:hypothetical protein
VRFVLDDGRQHGEQDQGARARPTLGACATRPVHAVNMLAEERRCKRHPGAASMQLHGCAVRASCRHAAALPEPQSSALKSCVPLAPSQGRTSLLSLAPGDGRTMCELVWGELGKFVNKRQVRRKHPLYTLQLRKMYPHTRPLEPRPVRASHATLTPPESSAAHPGSNGHGGGPRHTSARAKVRAARERTGPHTATGASRPRLRPAAPLASRPPPLPRRSARPA